MVSLRLKPFILSETERTSLTVMSCSTLRRAGRRFIAEGFQEILFVLVQILGFLLRNEFERVTLDHLGGAFLDHPEQDHGHHLVERLLHQDGGLHRGQSALDAVSFDGDLGRQVLQFAAVGVDDAHAMGNPKKIPPKQQMNRDGAQDIAD